MRFLGRFGPETLHESSRRVRCLGGSKAGRNGFPATRVWSALGCCALLIGCRGDLPSNSPTSGAAVGVGTHQSSPGSPTSTVAHGASSGLLSVALQSTDALVALSQLQDPIISECMKGAGFEYQPEAASLHVQSFGDFLAKRYLSPVRAADGRWGYVFSGRDIVDPEQPALPPSAASAFFGADVGQRELVDSDGNSMGEVRIGNGCLGQAQARVLGSPEEYLSFMSDVALSESILSKSYSLLLSDPEFSKRMASWSTCMKRVGEVYRTIFDPPNRDWPDPRPSSIESRTAGHDAACRDEAGATPPQLASIEDQIAAKLAADNVGVLDRLGRVQDRLLQAARRG